MVNTVCRSSRVTDDSDARGKHSVLAVRAHVDGTSGVRGRNRADCRAALQQPAPSLAP